MAHKHRIAAPLCAAALTGAALLATTISPPPAAAQGCPDIEVVFARGTNDPPGPGPVGQAFTDSLRSKVGGRAVGLYAVNYAATMNFLRVADGVNDANNHVNFMIANCPATRLVLGGFSQGAAVIDLLVGASLGAGAIPGLGGIPGLGAIPNLDLGGVAPPLSPDAANHVAAVATLGNPIDKASGPLNGQAGVYGSRTIDLCNAGDPICGPGNMNDMAAHHAYIPGGTDQAASFAAGLV
jgi:cutinase